MTEWSHSGETGPPHWGALCPAWALCAQGEAQSPVDIPPQAPVRTGPLRFDYQPGRGRVHANGWTLQVDWPPGSWLWLKNDGYQLQQFHFHAPSEHTVAGVRSAFELHFVHQNLADELVVVAVFLALGQANPAVALLVERLDELAESESVLTPRMELDPLLPERREHWRYHGSLTTPPCTEGVLWLVMQTPITVSTVQAQALGQWVRRNARPLQPLNRRTFT